MFLGNRGLNLTIDLRRRSEAAEGLRRLSRTAACATPECGRTPHDLLDAQLAPLHACGWSVQVLFPRALYFGPDMMYCECLQYSASELSPNLRNLAVDRPRVLK